jgi:N-methylhydantoinase A
VSFCVGVDVGGTFTDVVLTDATHTWRAKAPTTPGRLGDGVLAATRLAAERAGLSLDALLSEVRRFGLGTTAVTNALAARAGRRVGLLVTMGFEEMVPQARGTRVADADGWLVPPPPIVVPHAITGIDERIDRDGNVVVPLDPGTVTAAVTRMLDEHAVEAIAISYLWSFVNPAHEAASVIAVRDVAPGVAVVAGSDLHPTIREYERTTHTVLNAYVSGALGGIEELAAELARLGLPVPLLLVSSAGGSITVAEARRQPLGLALSGPAAGVAASVEVGAAIGIDHLITCDMGGTSFDVSVVVDGNPARRMRGDLMGVWTALSRIDVVSIGAGGGSLGWIDARKVLRVGPRSAGAVPGPACYGRGGTEATVTDALVVLGFLDPARFLGGDFALDADAARDACARLGADLGLDADDTAWGIRVLALAGMVKATRARIAAFGLDPRDHALLSFGGSGSLFTPEIAHAIGAPQVIVPELAAVLSAFGAATADVRRERLRSVLATVPVDPTVVEKLAEELVRIVDADLEADGVAPDDRHVEFEADLRFAKQSVELTIPVPSGPLATALEQLVDDFRDEYAKRFGRGSIVLGTPIEMVSLRAVGVGRTTRAALGDGSAPPVADGTAAPVAGTRAVHLARGADGVRAVTVHDGNTLAPGYTLAGPALIDGSDTTVWVPGGTRARVDALGSLVIQIAADIAAGSEGVA